MIFPMHLCRLFLRVPCAERNQATSKVIGAVPHEKRREFGVSSGSSRTIRYRDYPAIVFRAYQPFKIIAVDSNDNPLLLTGHLIDFLIGYAALFVVVAHVLNIKVLIQAGVLSAWRHVLIKQQLVFIKRFRHGRGMA